MVGSSASALLLDAGSVLLRDRILIKQTVGPQWVVWLLYLGLGEELEALGLARGCS